MRILVRALLVGSVLLEVRVATGPGRALGHSISSGAVESGRIAVKPGNSATLRGAAQDTPVLIRDPNVRVIVDDHGVSHHPPAGA